MKSRRFGTEGEITVAFADLLKSLWFSKYTAANSKHFTALVQQWSRRRDGVGFSAGVQQDAQEFLSWLLEKVHEDLNAGTKTHVRMSKVKFAICIL